MYHHSFFLITVKCKSDIEVKYHEPICSMWNYAMLSVVQVSQDTYRHEAAIASGLIMPNHRYLGCRSCIPNFSLKCASLARIAQHAITVLVGLFIWLWSSDIHRRLYIYAKRYLILYPFILSTWALCNSSRFIEATVVLFSPAITTYIHKHLSKSACDWNMHLTTLFVAFLATGYQVSAQRGSFRDDAKSFIWQITGKFIFNSNLLHFTTGLY